jgi:murein L,D-transpeptidase YcbB/YkuD
MWRTIVVLSALTVQPGLGVPWVPFLPGDPPQISLRLNLPSFRLELYEDMRLVRRYRVAIGDTAYVTPTGSFEVSRVDWDPWWIPPRSEWAEDDSITPPGPLNPMGRVRLAFRDLYFMHGTPNGQSIGRPASHGCVRLTNADAIDLAKRVLSYGAPSVPPDEIRKLAAQRGKTRSISLERRVSLEIRYEVAEVVDATLVLYPDVYHRLTAQAMTDTAVALLRRFGANSGAIDTALVRLLVENARERPLSVDLQELVNSHRDQGSGEITPRNVAPLF